MMYDLAIVGSGPSGMACAISASLDGLKVVLYGATYGGQIGTTSLVRNYPAYQRITGKTLAHKLYRQVVRSKVDIVEHDATSLNVNARAIVLATGMTFKKLGTSLDTWVGRGVFYGASPSYCTGHALIVGGANSAGQMALYLASHGCKVTMCIRGTSLDHTMSMYLVNDVKRNVNIRVCLHTELVSCHGDTSRIRSVALSNGEELTVNRVYVFVGQVPNTDWIPVDKVNGYIQVSDYRTSSENVFAIGDCRVGSVHRVASAIGDGSNVVPYIYKYLEG